MLLGKRPKPEDTLDDNINKLSCSEDGKSFIKGLLQPVEANRLGIRNGATEVLQHVWCKSIDIQKLENREIIPEFLPDTTRANCETSPDDLAALFLPPVIEDPLPGIYCFPFLLI